MRVPKVNAHVTSHWAIDEVLLSNVVDFKKSIPLELLPSLIQDAIQITKRLGVCYLWVDALDIIQDAGPEKIADIGALEQIYRNALLTITADVESSSSIEGMFQTGSANDDREHLTGILGDQGWILQEQVLSAQVLTFSSNKIYWDCTGISAAEFQPESLMFEQQEASKPDVKLK